MIAGITEFLGGLLNPNAIKQLTCWIDSMLIRHDLNIDCQKHWENSDEDALVTIPIRSFGLIFSRRDKLRKLNPTHLPELSTNLVTTLSSLNMNDFPHV